MISIDQKSLKLWQDSEAESMRYNYSGISNDDLVIDIGSYQKEWGNEMIKRYGCKVESFEALDNRAAWTYDGEIAMGGQFYYTSMFDKGQLGEVKKYKCVDIAPYLQSEIAVLKMNIEGAEYELLAYIIEKGLHKNIRNLQVQFHQIDGFGWQQGYDYIHDELLKTHELTWRYPFCWENWQRKTIPNE